MYKICVLKKRVHVYVKHTCDSIKISCERAIYHVKPLH